MVSRLASPSAAPPGMSSVPLAAQVGTVPDWDGPDRQTVRREGFDLARRDVLEQDLAIGIGIECHLGQPSTIGSERRHLDRPDAHHRRVGVQDQGRGAARLRVDDGQRTGRRPVADTGPGAWINTEARATPSQVMD